MTDDNPTPEILKLTETASKRDPFLPIGWVPWNEPRNPIALDSEISSLIASKRRPNIDRSRLKDMDCPYYFVRERLLTVCGHLREVEQELQERLENRQFARDQYQRALSHTEDALKQLRAALVALEINDEDYSAILQVFGPGPLFL